LGKKNGDITSMQEIDVIEEYQKYFSDRKQFSFPLRVTVELTNHCNLDCPICPRQYLVKRPDYKEGFMDKELYQKIIDEMAEYPNVALVPFFRGESLLHPEFIKMLAYAKEKGIKPIQLATNATLLNEKTSRNLLDLEIDFISFSLDASGKESYEKIRVGANYEKVMENIENFLVEKQERGLKRPAVQVSVVKTEATKEKIPRFISFWLKKVERVRVYEEHSTNRKFGSLKNSPDLKEERKPCLKPLSDIVIYWDGDVALCNHDWNRKEPFGNIRKESIRNVWNGKNYNEIRKRQFENRAEEDPTCKGCDHWRLYYLPKRMIGELHTKND